LHPRKPPDLFLDGGPGNDVLDGGSGNDSARYGASRDNHTVLVAPDGRAAVAYDPRGGDGLE